MIVTVAVAPVGCAENPAGVSTPDASTGGSAAANSWALVAVTGRNDNSVPLQTFTELLLGLL